MAALGLGGGRPVLKVRRIVGVRLVAVGDDAVALGGADAPGIEAVHRKFGAASIVRPGGEWRVVIAMCGGIAEKNTQDHFKVMGAILGVQKGLGPSGGV